LGFYHGLLGGVPILGYEYILRPELDEIRQQFDYPEHRMTQYLDQAKYCFAASSSLRFSQSQANRFCGAA